MTRRVIVIPQAKFRLVETAEWWSKHRSAEQAARWLTGFEIAIENLATTADQWPLALEASRLGLPLRQMNYGLSRHPTHRAIYKIDRDIVVVVAIRHLAEDELQPGDV